MNQRNATENVRIMKQGNDGFEIKIIKDNF